MAGNTASGESTAWSYEQGTTQSATSGALSWERGGVAVPLESRRGGEGVAATYVHEL
jgi:hypothetical protein